MSLLLFFWRRRVPVSTTVGGAIRPTVAVELELSGVGGGWTDISDYLVAQSTLVIRHGILSSAPTALLAGTPTCLFTLRNDPHTAGGLGYYSLYHANKRSGWGLGIGCRVRMTDPATSIVRTRFRGRIDAIGVQPGRHVSPSVRVIAVGWMDEAARWKLTPEVGEQLNQRGDQISTAVIAAMPVPPPATDFDMGQEAYPYALDTSGGTKDTAYGIFGKLTRSDLSLMYEKADGTLRHENRNTRLLNTTPLWTVTEQDQMELTVPSTREEILNTVRVTMNPRTVDPLPTTAVYRQANTIPIPAGETKLLLGSFRDPVTGDLIGATDVQPVVPVTDYIGTENEDGTGSDLTSDLVFTVSVGPSGISAQIENTGGALAYVRGPAGAPGWQMRGKAIKNQGATQFPATDAASIAEFGEHAVEFNMDYQFDPNVGKAAANFLRDKFKDPFAQARTMVVHGKTPALLTQLLKRDISDRITVRETVTGVHDDFFINGEELTVLPSGHVKSKYYLAPSKDPFNGVYWVLGIAGKSELGVTTGLGF